MCIAVVGACGYLGRLGGVGNDVFENMTRLNDEVHCTSVRTTSEGVKLWIPYRNVPVAVPVRLTCCHRLGVLFSENESLRFDS